MQRIESSKLYIACDLASSHGMDPCLHHLHYQRLDPCLHYLHYQRWTRRPDINNPTISSTFLARGKTYKVFQLGAKVEVVVRSALSGNEICKKSVTTDEWYLLYKMQKFSDSDMPMEDHEADLSEPFFLAFQEDVGGCLKAPSCSIEVMEVTCNGIGVASRAMTRTSKIKAITNFCGEDTQIDLPGVPSRLHLETPLRYYSFSQAFWRVQREQHTSSLGRKSEHVGWSLTINIMRDRHEVHPPAFVEVKLVSRDKIDGTDDHDVFAIFTRHVHELRRNYRFGPFDLQAYRDSKYGASGFFLCLKSWEEKL